MTDDLLCDMRPPKTALERFIEEEERDDTLARRIERIHASHRRILRLYGIPEHDVPPLARRLANRDSGSER
jgi:hypothetical protein